MTVIKSRTLKHISITFIGQVGARIITALAIMIVIRHLTKQEFGAISVIQSVIAIGSGVIFQGINWLFITSIASNRENKKYIFDLVNSIFSFTIFFSFAIALIILFVSHFFPRLISNNYLFINNSYFIAWGIIINSLMNFSISFFQGNNEFIFSSFVTLLQSALLFVIYIILSFLNLINLFIVLVLATSLPIIPFIALRTKFKGFELTISLKVDAILELVKTSKWYIIYSSLIVISGQLDVLMMSKYFDLRDVGIYAVAAKIYSFFLIGLSAIHTVLLPKFASINSYEKQKKFLFRSMRLSIPISISLSLGIFIFGHLLIRLFAGPGYEDAVLPLKILGISAAISLIFSPSVNVLFAAFEIKKIAIAGMLLVCVSLASHIIITSQLGAVGAAISTLLAYTSINLFLFFMIITRQENKVKK